jgi:hypothetical protein
MKELYIATITTLVPYMVPFPYYIFVCRHSFTHLFMYTYLDFLVISDGEVNRT